MEQKEQTPKNQSLLARFFHKYGYLVVTALVTIALFRGVFILAYVPTGSMEPTLPTHSVFVAMHLPFLVSDPVPEQGDIIMFHSEEFQETMVKRLIGLPGQTVSFADGGVLVDGVPLEEDYLPAGTETWPAQMGDTFEVPEGYVFLMGDNRGNSLDSRYWENPFIPLSDLSGHALVDFSLLPKNTWKGIRYVG